MLYKKGGSRPMEDVTLQDMLEYPIWTFAIDEEGVDGQDETWQKPIFSKDVKKKIFRCLYFVKNRIYKSIYPGKPIYR